MAGYNRRYPVGAAIARLRLEANVTQAALAERSGLDQSRISRIERGEIVAPADLDKAIDALDALDVIAAKELKEFSVREWRQIEPPSFWNSQRVCLEIADETLGKIESFLTDDERPWPLRRQIERHQDSLRRAAAFLGREDHNIAFVGDMGVGKSTAISFGFDLLVPPSMADKQINRPVLETGAGGTTICEVRVKSGPEFGFYLVPMNDSEMRDLVADFCAAKWALLTTEAGQANESVGVSRENERAIRNMCGLGRRREKIGGKLVYHDPVLDMAKSCGSEEEFRTRVLGLIRLEDRTRAEIWYNSATRQHPMEWVTETFRAINNGRLADVPLPKSIDLLIPNFGRSFGELEITVVDTKGVDDVAVRTDLDQRLRDPRTAIVFCSHFNDAPGTTTRVLLQHMRQTFSERLDTGKVSVLALPRAGEARAMKDDMGELALTDEEGYEFKNMQVSSELSVDDLADVPMIFYNVESDEPTSLRMQLFDQLNRMRKTVESRLFDLCAAVDDIIEHHETQALNAAIEEVAHRLSTFLGGNRRLGAREQLAYAGAINTVKGVRYASTLWASTRRNGEYSGLDILHLIGVGAARDAHLRSDSWFKGLDRYLNSLRADPDLELAKRSIDQIAAIASTSKRSFLEAVQRGGVEVYSEQLSQAPVWGACTREWGKGPGYKLRVADHLEKWFTAATDPKDKLEDMINALWERMVIAPMLRLVEESEPEISDVAANVLSFPGQAAP